MICSNSEDFKKVQKNASICSSEVIHSPKYSYFKFIFIYSEIISQPSNYTTHNNPKSRISRLDWHVYTMQIAVYLIYLYKKQFHRP